jgi:hypothetical protein
MGATPNLPTVIAGRAALEINAKAAGLDHAPANEPKGSQTRMSGNEVEHWANKTAGGYHVVRSARKETE